LLAGDDVNFRIVVKPSFQLARRMQSNRVISPQGVSVGNNQDPGHFGSPELSAQSVKSWLCVALIMDSPSHQFWMCCTSRQSVTGKTS
jgi:hypothetical protein